MKGFFFLFYSSVPDLNSVKWWGECHCTFLRQCLPFSQWSLPLIQAWYLRPLVLGTIMLCDKQSSNSEFSKIGLHSPIHASLVAQMVNDPTELWKTWVWSLVWEDPLEEEMATHSSILAWRIPMDWGAWQATVHGTAKNWMWLSD